MLIGPHFSDNSEDRTGREEHVCSDERHERFDTSRDTSCCRESQELMGAVSSSAEESRFDFTEVTLRRKTAQCLV